MHCAKRIYVRNDIIAKEKKLVKKNSKIIENTQKKMTLATDILCKILLINIYYWNYCRQSRQNIVKCEYLESLPPSVILDRYAD